MYTDSFTIYKYTIYLCRYCKYKSNLRFGRFFGRATIYTYLLIFMYDIDCQLLHQDRLCIQIYGYGFVTRMTRAFKRPTEVSEPREAGEVQGRSGEGCQINSNLLEQGVGARRWSNVPCVSGDFSCFFYHVFPLDQHLIQPDPVKDNHEVS